MPVTARQHFDEDLNRVRAILDQADALEAQFASQRLVADLRSTAIAMSTGAMDAYLCDAYVDCLSSVLRAYRQGTWTGDLPSYYSKERLPAGAVLDASRPYRPLWAIRMAARNIMARENILSIADVDKRFNPILPPGQKIWAAFLPSLLVLDHRRLTGRKTASEINALTGKAREKATKKAISAVKDRIHDIAQIRHDWIHNCGRPKVTIKTYSKGQATQRIRHVEFFVHTLDVHLEAHRLA